MLDRDPVALLASKKRMLDRDTVAVRDGKERARRGNGCIAGRETA